MSPVVNEPPRTVEPLNSATVKMFMTRSIAPPGTVELLNSAAVHLDVHGKDR